MSFDVKTVEQIDALLERINGEKNGLAKGNLAKRVVSSIKGTTLGGSILEDVTVKQSTADNNIKFIKKYRELLEIQSRIGAKNLEDVLAKHGIQKDKVSVARSLVSKTDNRVVAAEKHKSLERLIASIREVKTARVENIKHENYYFRVSEEFKYARPIFDRTLQLVLKKLKQPVAVKVNDDEYPPMLRYNETIAKNLSDIGVVYPTADTLDRLRGLYRDAVQNSIGFDRNARSGGQLSNMRGGTYDSVYIPTPQWFTDEVKRVNNVVLGFVKSLGDRRKKLKKYPSLQGLLVYVQQMVNLITSHLSCFGYISCGQYTKEVMKVGGKAIEKVYVSTFVYTNFNDPVANVRSCGVYDLYLNHSIYLAIDVVVSECFTNWCELWSVDPSYPGYTTTGFSNTHVWSSIRNDDNKIVDVGKTGAEFSHAVTVSIEPVLDKTELSNDQYDRQSGLILYSNICVYAWRQFIISPNIRIESSGPAKGFKIPRDKKDPNSNAVRVDLITPHRGDIYQQSVYNWFIYGLLAKTHTDSQGSASDDEYVINKNPASKPDINKTKIKTESATDNEETIKIHLKLFEKPAPENAEDVSSFVIVSYYTTYKHKHEVSIGLISLRQTESELIRFGYGEYALDSKDPLAMTHPYDKIVMRADDYAQFHHHVIDYKYCDKADSKYYKKFIPAYHPCLELMESDEYIPNACVLSTFISLLRADFNGGKGYAKLSYENLVVAAGLVPKKDDKGRAAKKYVQEVRALGDKAEIPVTIDMLHLIAVDLKCKAAVYNTDGLLIKQCGVAADKVSKNHRSSFNFVYANGHLYYIESPPVNKISPGVKNTAILGHNAKMPDGIYHCREIDDSKIISSNLHSYNLEEWLADTTKWSGNIIIKDNSDMLYIFNRIREISGYIPMIKLNGLCIRGLSGSQILNSIRTSWRIVPSVDETDVMITDPVEYFSYAKLAAKLKNKILCYKNRSDYTEDTKRMFFQRCSPFNGGFGDTDVYGMKQIDCSKHYTTEMLEMPGFQVFSIFDKMEKVDVPMNVFKCGDLADMTNYLFSFDRDTDLTIAPPGRRNLTALGAAVCLMEQFTNGPMWLAGYIIKRLLRALASANIMAKGMVTAQIVPHKVNNNPVPYLLEGVTYDAPTKRAVNEVWGRLGSHELAASVSTQYSDILTADSAIDTIKSLSRTDAKYAGIKIDKLVVGADNNGAPSIVVVTATTKAVPYINGFLPIKKCLYDASRVAVIELVCKLQVGFGCTFVGCKTDALYWAPTPENLCALLNAQKEGEIVLGRDPGTYNIPDKLSPVPALKMPKTADAWYFVLDDDHVDRVEVVETETNSEHLLANLMPLILENGKEDERDSLEVLMGGVKQTIGNVIIHGIYPGVGKSYMSHYVSRSVVEYRNTYRAAEDTTRYRALFVTPYNELKLDNYDLYKEIGDVTTTASLFGMYVAPDGSLTRHAEGKDFAIGKEICAIVFDEIYLNGISALTQIKRLMDARPDIVYIANGDYDGQFKAIDNYYNERIVNSAVRQMFSAAAIKLTIIKRNLRADYKDFVNAIKMSKTPQSTLEIVKKFGIRTSNDVYEMIKSSRAITWRNTSRAALNKLHTPVVVVGTRIRCHTFFELVNRGEYDASLKTKSKRPRLGKSSFRTGDSFEIIAFEDEKPGDKGPTVTMRPVDGSENKFAPIVRITRAHMSHFGVKFAKTCHSYQGATIRSSVAIFDLFTVSNNKPDEYDYVAFTRNTNLDDIVVYTGETSAMFTAVGVKLFHGSPSESQKKKQICGSCMHVLAIAEEHQCQPIATPVTK